MFRDFLVGIHRNSDLTVTSLNRISDDYDTRQFVMVILHWKQGLLCGKITISVVLYEEFRTRLNVQRDPMVECLTRNSGVLGSSRTGSSRSFRGSVLWQDTSEHQPITGETQKRYE